MRRFFGLLLLASVAAPSSIWGQQALVGMYPAGVAVDSGLRASVPIVADLRGLAGTFLGSYQLQVSWNPAIVRYVGTSAGAFGAPTVNESNAASGTLLIAGARPDGRQGLFSVAEVTFEMLTSSGSSPVLVTSPELTETGSFAAIPVIATPGNVCNGPADFGDVNGDGNILSNDALLVVTAAVGLPIAPYTLTNADVDSDGDADTRDALIILTAAVGLPTTGFVVGQPNLASSCGGAAAATIALNPGVATVATGDVFPISVEVFDAGGAPTAATGLVWSSDAGGVATVDSVGRVTAVGNGAAQISALAIGVPSQSVSVTVENRHTWYVDAVGAAHKTVQLGSAFFPFGDVQPALDASVAGDTLLVVYAPSGYGAASISKAVTVLGDSGSYGMPALRNSVGTAVVSNAPGLVTLRHLILEEANAGLDARGDSLILTWVAARSLRGPAFTIRAMQFASLLGASVNSAVLAGVLADSNGFVDISAADIRVIANRNDSAVAIAVLNGGRAQVTDLKVVGVENGSAVVFSKIGRGVLDVFDVRSAGGVNADSVGSMTVAAGVIYGGGAGGDRPLSIHADTVVVDSVVVNGADRGVEISPMARDTITQPNTFANISRSAVLNVAGPGGLIVDRIGVVHISRMTVTNIQLDHGIDVRRPTAVRIDSSNVTGIAEGIAVRVDPATSLVMIGGKLRGQSGGLWADRVQLALLTNLEVDSSAVTSRFCFGCAAQFAVVLGHADSVVLDGLNVHDNVGGGVLVDSARTVTGRGSIVARNQGQGGSGGGECEFGCEQQGSGPQRSAQFTLNQAPGAILTLVQQTHLAGWTIQDNVYGGLWIGWGQLVAPQAIIDTSSFRGQDLLTAAGDFGDAQLVIRGGSFRVSDRAIQASNLGRLSMTGVLLDSLVGSAQGAIQATNVHELTLWDDTVTAGAGYVFQIQGGYVDARRNVIRNRPVSYQFVQESALDLYAVDSAFVYGNRLEFNGIRGIIVHGGGGGLITIDSNVVTDDSSYALQLHRPATVTRNLFARNSNAIWVDFGGEPSQIHQNNFEGNVFSAIYNSSNDITSASGNWWNDPLGPRCGGVVVGCDPGATGDIVYGVNFTVDYSAPLPARDVSGAPLAAPAMRTSVRAVNR